MRSMPRMREMAEPYERAARYGGGILAGPEDFEQAVEREVRRRLALRSAAIGVGAVGALTLGAVAVGALAIGAMSVGRLALGKARIGRLRIDELDVERLRVHHIDRPGGEPPESARLPAAHP